ncbi:xanthine dehydrogenase family protein molybdopterin-binding subunit [bacterium]|nr:xanthine dehydrogenase family protein molybdopterin-binding subunit [bacterium]
MAPKTVTPPPVAMDDKTDFNVVGTSPRRIDANDKVSGQAQYADDLKFSGMLHAAIRTSDIAHGVIKSVDISAAEALPGVEAVMLGKDIPGENQIGIIFQDQPLLAENKVRWYGDWIAIVAARSLAIAREAVKLIKVEYEELEGVFSPEEGLVEGAPKIHEKGNILETMHVRTGEVEKGFADSDVVLERVYRVNYQEHAYLETNGCVAVPALSDSITIHVSCQCPFYVQNAVRKIIGVPAHKIRVLQSVTGGAFGGKEDYPSEPAAVAAALAWKTGKPVKLIYQREEDVAWSSKRHRYTIYHKMGATKDGKLTTVHLKVLCDVGAYAGLSTIVSDRANISSIGPYNVPNIHVDTYCVYTNNLFGGAFRGFGAPQVAFAHETAMDDLAEKLGMDPAELRRINAFQKGDNMASGQPIPGRVPCLETIDKATDACDWKNRRAAYDKHNAGKPLVRKGLGMSTIIYGVNLHARGEYINRSGAHMRIFEDGSVAIAIGLTEMGQGLLTAAVQMAAEALGVTVDRVNCNQIDTALVPDSGPTVASRSTVMSGFPLIQAAGKLRDTLLNRAGEVLGRDASELDMRKNQIVDAKTGEELMTYDQAVGACFKARENLTEVGWYAVPHQEWDLPTGQGVAYHSFAFATQIADVEVNSATGQIDVKNVWAAHDVGRAINPNMLTGQIEGGVVQGMGWALMENLILRKGKCINPGFTDYLIPTSLDAPKIHSILIEDPTPAGPFGIKGIGEPSLIPMAGAIGNAISHAVGYRFEEVPVTPEVVLMALAGKPKNPLGWQVPERAVLKY